jgi:conserved repeat protein
VPAGGNAVIAYEAVPTAFAPPTAEGTVTNSASVTGAGLANPVTATETVAPEAAPALTINKSLSPTTVTENSRLTYTFTIQNTGNTAADAAAAIVITDTFDPRLTDLTVTLNGTALTAPTQYTYDAATGVFATAAGVVTVPAATFTQDAATGAYSTTPGTAVLTVTGTV